MRELKKEQRGHHNKSVKHQTQHAKTPNFWCNKKSMPYHRTTDGASTSSIASTVVVAGSCCALALYYMHQIRKHHGEKSLSFLNSVIPKSLQQQQQQQQAREQNLKEKKKLHTTTTTRDETSIHSSVLDSIGNTPLVKVLSLSEMTKCEIYAKCEFYNPGGSVKDRVALQIVQEAMERKKLNKGGLVTEGTAGSTGVSLAMVASVLRLNCHVVMPDDAATEKSAQVLAYGATVERVRPVSITHADHFVNVAKRRAEESNEQFGEGSGYFADQFENLANFRAHYNGTGKEIYEQMIDNETNIKGAKVIVLGLTFKENCSDIRNTRVIDIYNDLVTSGCDVDVYDPLVNVPDLALEYEIMASSNLKSNYYFTIRYSESIKGNSLLKNYFHFSVESNKHSNKNSTYLHFNEFRPFFFTSR